MDDAMMKGRQHGMPGAVQAGVEQLMKDKVDEWFALAARQGDTETVLHDWFYRHRLYYGQAEKGGNWFCQAADGFNLHKPSELYGQPFPTHGFTTWAAMLEAALDWVLAQAVAE